MKILSRYLRQRLLRHQIELSRGLDYPSIDPVAEGLNRPFWSVMIPTYNCGKYLERCLTSILDQAQGPSEMQIQVVDNCSTDDDTEAIVRKIGKERIAFLRQPRNVGVSANFVTCIREAKGHWVHIMHGDDMLTRSFYRTYDDFIRTYPDLVMVFGRAAAIDEKDNLKSLLYDDFKTRVLEDPLVELLAKNNVVVAPTAVVNRNAYERIGGFTSSLSPAVDWEMWTRLAALGRIGFVGEPHLLYRVHSESETREAVLKANIIAESVICILAAASQLPSGTRDRTLERALAAIANSAGAYRDQLQIEGAYAAALRHATWEWRLAPSISSSKALIKCAAQNLFFPPQRR